MISPNMFGDSARPVSADTSVRELEWSLGGDGCRLVANSIWGSIVI